MKWPARCEVEKGVNWIWGLWIMWKFPLVNDTNLDDFKSAGRT